MIILGLPFDNGIRSMKRFGRGIAGAKDGPKAVFNLLENINLKKEMLLLESFNISSDKEEDIERQKMSTSLAHDIVEQKIRSLNESFIAIGGDHSLTHSIVKGLKKGEKIALVVLDAHFDMRPLEEGIVSSGNAFYRLLEEKIIDKVVFFGIVGSKTDAFEMQKKYALSKGVKFYYDYQFDISSIRKELSKFDKIYVSIDIDVLNEKFALGVSARNKKGINDKQFFAFIEEITKHNIIALDFMEISSREDDFLSLQKTAEIVAKAIKIFTKNINSDNKAIL